MPSDSALGPALDAARAGEEWGVTLLYRDLHPRLVRYLRAQEPRAADDVEGEVWLAVARGLGAFDGDVGAFNSWVFAIARRRLADLRRTASRRRTEPSPPEALDRPSGDDPERTVVDELSGQDAAAFVARVLPADQADVVLLRVLGGLDVDEVARLLGKRPGTVRVLQHRALRRLNEWLSQEAVTR